MKRALTILLLVCAACSSTPAPTPTPSPSASRVPLKFRVVARAADGCVPGPDYATATTEDQWIDVWDQETSCRKQQDVSLPNVDFTKEFAVVARWGPRDCVVPEVLSAEIEGTTAFLDVRVAQHSCVYRPGPPPQPETFVAVRRAPALCATTLVVLRTSPANEFAHVPWIAPPCGR